MTLPEEIIFDYNVLTDDIIFDYAYPGGELGEEDFSGDRLDDVHTIDNNGVMVSLKGRSEHRHASRFESRHDGQSFEP